MMQYGQCLTHITEYPHDLSFAKYTLLFLYLRASHCKTANHTQVKKQDNVKHVCKTPLPALQPLDW